MHTLTARGRTLVAIGVVGLVAGWGFGQEAVVAVAILLVLLPATGAILVRRSRFVLGSARSVTPGRITYGEEAEVVLTVENGARFTSGVLLLEDVVPEQLGHPTRLLLDRVPPHAQRAERYRIRGLQRGRARVGPLTVTLTDPFGMSVLARSFTTTNSVAVTPRIVALGSSAASRAPGGEGESLFRALASRGDDDLLPREHRAGDDVRRIHWRATARQGELMVRREEQAWHSSVIVILDDRRDAYTEAGSSPTFEWAVSAAASIALHYLRHGWRLTVVTTTGRVLVEARSANAGDIDLVMHAFADVERTDAVTSLRLAEDTSVAIVAILGSIPDETARALVQPTAGYAGCLLLDPRPLELLRSRGWQVATCDPSTLIDEAWGRIDPLTTGAAR